MVVSRTRGSIFGGAQNKDYNILGDPNISGTTKSVKYSRKRILAKVKQKASELLADGQAEWPASD